MPPALPEHASVAPLALEHDLAIAPEVGSVSQKGSQKTKPSTVPLSSLTDELPVAVADSNSNAREDAAQSVRSEDECSENSQLLDDLLEASGRDEAPIPPDPISHQQGAVGSVDVLAGRLPPSEMSEDGPGAANNSDAQSNVVSSVHRAAATAVRGEVSAPNPAPARPATAAAALERREAAAAMGAALSWTSFKFGAFRFTSKKPKTSAQYSWQVTCPFHAKSNHTACKKNHERDPSH